jgi:hypothetical protein
MQICPRVLDKFFATAAAAEGVGYPCMDSMMLSLVRLDLHAADRIGDRLRRCRCSMQIVPRWMGMFHTLAFALRISGGVS